uniref:Transmembrane protein n=1 Tax=Neospora caninum (strain Liverpool) TaxID=572307 RepID=A0A0F7U3L3_NEOCL|nr:TPA: hypothetical protein BN1204_002550 [Neospora caninum Liverpool]
MLAGATDEALGTRLRCGPSQSLCLLWKRQTKAGTPSVSLAPLASPPPLEPTACLDPSAVFSPWQARRLRKRNAVPAICFSFSLVFAVSLLLPCALSATGRDENGPFFSSARRGDSTVSSPRSNLPAQERETAAPRQSEEATVGGLANEKDEESGEISPGAHGARTPVGARRGPAASPDGDASAPDEQQAFGHPHAARENRNASSEQETSAAPPYFASRVSSSPPAAPQTSAIEGLLPTSLAPPIARGTPSFSQTSPSKNDTLVRASAENTSLLPPSRSFFRTYFRLARSPKCIFARALRGKSAFCHWPGLEGFADPRGPKQKEKEPSSSVSTLAGLAPSGTVVREVFPVHARDLPGLTRDSTVIGAARRGGGRFFSLQFPASAYGPSETEAPGDCETGDQALESLFLSQARREACRRHPTSDFSPSEEAKPKRSQALPKDPRGPLGAGEASEGQRRLPPRAANASESGERRGASLNRPEEGWLSGPVIFFEKLSFFIPVASQVHGQAAPRYLVALRAKLRGARSRGTLGQRQQQKEDAENRGNGERGERGTRGKREEGEEREEEEEAEEYVVEGRCRLFAAGMAWRDLPDTVRLTLKDCGNRTQSREEDWAITTLDISTIMERERNKKRGDSGFEIRCVLNARQASGTGDEETQRKANLWTGEEDEEEIPQILPSNILTVVVGKAGRRKVLPIL